MIVRYIKNLYIYIQREEEFIEIWVSCMEIKKIRIERNKKKEESVEIKKYTTENKIKSQMKREF